MASRGPGCWFDAINAVNQFPDASFNTLDQARV